MEESEEEDEAVSVKGKGGPARGGSKSKGGGVAKGSSASKQSTEGVKHWKVDHVAEAKKRKVRMCSRH
jgi:hypothetical protein